MLAKFAISD